MRRMASRTDGMATMTTVSALWGPGAAWSASADGVRGAPQAGGVRRRQEI